MKPKIPFRIGYQYDNWELDVITLPDRIPENDLYISYLWVGNETKMFLNFPPHRTELIFYWDILNTVILTFLDRDIEYYYKILSALETKFGQSEMHKNKRAIINKYKTKNIEYWCIYKLRTITIQYGISQTMNRIYNTLLC